MPKTRAQKERIVGELAEKIGNAKAIFVVAPKAINPNEAAELKIKLDEVGGSYNVIKNNLFVRALEQLGLTAAEGSSVGQNAIVLVGDQSPEAAKILKQFIKESEKAEFKGGYLEGKTITSSEIEALAELPSREQLIAQVLGTMQAPISGLVNVLAGNTRNIVNVIEAYRKQKAGE